MYCQPVAFAHRWPCPIVSDTIVDAWELTRSALLDVGRRMDYLIALQQNLHDGSTMSEEMARVLGREWTGSSGTHKQQEAVLIALSPGHDSYVKWFLAVAEQGLRDQALIVPSAVILQRFVRLPLTAAAVDKPSMATCAEPKARAGRAKHD